MRHYTLNQIMKTQHLSDLIFKNQTFTPEKMITDLGLYEAVVIDTSNISWESTRSPGPYPGQDFITINKVWVSKDVQALHSFLLFKESVMLPCAECKRTQPFSPCKSINPQKATNYLLKHDVLNEQEAKDNPEPTSKKQREISGGMKNERNRFIDGPVFRYILGENELKHISGNLQADIDKKQVMQSCIDGILEAATEFRRDFLCSYNNQHRIIVDCILQRAIDFCKEPKELQEYRKRKEADPEIEMTGKEKEISEQYEHLKYCLILEKVGQEPSMADLQMFDIEKYRKVLSDDKFRDFSMALGLYASGVGCGSLLYLRRIFESIVIEAQNKCCQLSNWNDEEYLKKRFNEKIEYLEMLGERIIPEELSDVKEKIYGWLSKGIHELSDQESMELFQHLKYSIELILDEKIARKEKEAKLKELHKKLNS